MLVVDCAIEDQISRVMQRDQCSATHVQKIINSQVDRNTRLSMADDIINNKSTIDALQKQVRTLHNQYLELSDHISKT
jgi:dephospho-CoA kinase